MTPKLSDRARKAAASSERPSEVARNLASDFADHECGFYVQADSCEDCATRARRIDAAISEATRETVEALRALVDFVADHPSSWAHLGPDKVMGKAREVLARYAKEEEKTR